MRRIAFCASAGVLLACLAGWIALAGAQQSPPGASPEASPQAPLPGTVPPAPSPSTSPAAPVGTLPLDKAPASLPVAPSAPASTPDRKSTRLNSSHLGSSYAVLRLKKQQ